MLRNPAYCGRAAFGKTRQSDERPKVTRPVRGRGARGSVHFSTRDCPRDQWIEIPVPPLVSEELFDLAARRLEDNKRFASRRTKEPSLLQGLAACQSCGYSYYRTSTRTRKRRLYYYRCLGSDDYRYEQGRVCSNPPVRQDYLDEVVWNHVTALLTDPQRIRAELERRLEELRATSPITAQKAQLERELRRTERAIHRLVEAYQEELIALDELRRRTPELRKKATAFSGPARSARSPGRGSGAVSSARREPRRFPRASEPGSPELLDSGASAGPPAAGPGGARRTGASRDPALDPQLEGRSRPELSFAWEGSSPRPAECPAESRTPRRLPSPLPRA